MRPRTTAEDLPLIDGELAATWDDLFRPNGVPGLPFRRETVAALFQLGLGLAAWKYGARAFRYCQHDCGHMLYLEAEAAGVQGTGGSGATSTTPCTRPCGCGAPATRTSTTSPSAAP